MTRKRPPQPSKGSRRKTTKLPRPASELVANIAPRAEIHVGDISHVSGNMSIAGRDIVNNIQAIKRALTPGEVNEKDLQIELVELARGVRDYLDGLRQQITNAEFSVPYKGLEAYTLSDSQVFFGRNQAVRDLLKAMKRGPLTVLQAESGAGKTSLLQAGIVPQMILKHQLAVLIRPQFENPTQTIKDCFIRNLDLTPKLAATSLVNFLRWVSGIIGHQTSLYIILDQFEEFFAKQTLETDRQAFIHDLAECLNDPTLNVRWVIVLTSDALGQLGKFEPHVRNPFSNVQSLYLFTYQEAAEVIEKTAKHHGLSFEDGLLARILKDLGNQHNDPIAPTQIQLVCAALYEDLNDQATLFSHEVYDHNGGAQGILHDYIESVLTRHLPYEERAAAYKILEALVTSEKKRVVRAKPDLRDALHRKGVAAETFESTLNHLVKRRLLRSSGDDAEHMQYEIVHDYLLGEIEINENVRKAKEAEELLDQGLKNWQRQNLLLAPDAIKMLEARAENISIPSSAAKLLFLSAIEYGKPGERWRELISIEDQKEMVDSLLFEKDNRKNREALWSLRHHLTQRQKTKIALKRSSLAFLTSLQKAILVFLVAVAALVIGLMVVTGNKHFKSWTKVNSYYRQCEAGGVSSDLLVAIDAADTSRIVVYDSYSGALCETANTGAKWKPIHALLPPGVAVNAIAVNSAIYLATDQGIYYQDDKYTWRELSLLSQNGSPIERIVVSPDRRTIYVSTGQNSLFKHTIATGAWDEIGPASLAGNITDITLNYEFLAVSTKEGIWYQKIGSEQTWINNDFNSRGIATITSLKLVYPVKSWKYYFYGYDATKDDWFLATTEKGEIYSGYLTEQQQLQKIFISPTAISSLAVNGYSKFSVRSDGLYCEQTWTPLETEWWLRFGRTQPCT